MGRLFRGKLMAADSESSAFFTERITALAAQCGLGVETRLHGSGRADNASFLAQAIPAVHFSSGLHADYHQVTDEVSKLDNDGGARISWLGYRLLREMMDNPQRLRFRRPSPDFDVQGIIRLALRLGLEGPDQDGFYSVKQTLRRDVYEYKFVVNGNEWFSDRHNLRTTGTLGNSVLTLGSD